LFGVEHHRLFAHLFPDVRFYASFGNNFLQIKRFHSPIGDIPAQRLEERVDQLLARLSFVKRWGFELMDILFEEMNKLLDRGFCGASSCVHAVGLSGVLVFSPSLSRKNVEKSTAKCNELTNHP
jgi:hypothetical protein